MKIEIDFKWQGSQIRRYGPNQYDFTVALTPGGGLKEGFEYSPAVFERYARLMTPEWAEPGDHWFNWRLKKAERVGHNKWHFIVERPYDD